MVHHAILIVSTGVLSGERVEKWGGGGGVEGGTALSVLRVG